MSLSSIPESGVRAKPRGAQILAICEAKVSLRRINRPCEALVPLANAKLMHLLIPHSELHLFDCGHMFLMTRGEASARAINEFVDRP
jgi:pimeloyl-ACP methyl ester carboxylesterase